MLPEAEWTLLDEQAVTVVGFVLCALVLVLLTRRQVAVVTLGERPSGSRRGTVLLGVLLAAYWTVVGLQLWVVAR